MCVTGACGLAHDIVRLTKTPRSQYRINGVTIEDGRRQPSIIVAIHEAPVRPGSIVDAIGEAHGSPGLLIGDES